MLVTAGAVDEADDGTAPPAVTTTLVQTNFLGVVTLVGAFVERFERQGGGTIVLFSSIAAAAPRGRNVVYGAAKAALEHYGRSLQHRLAGEPRARAGLRVGLRRHRHGRGPAAAAPSGGSPADRPHRRRGPAQRPQVHVPAAVLAGDRLRAPPAAVADLSAPQLLTR